MSSIFTDNFSFSDEPTDADIIRLKDEYPDYDPYYIVSAIAKDRRDRFESLYKIYHPYADRHFLAEAKRHFHQRTWEMYVTCVLLERGLAVSSSDMGPDILIEDKAGKLWIECVAPDVGTGNDRVPELLTDFTVQDVPVREMRLRIMAGIEEKFSKYKLYVQNEVIAPEDRFVIAISRGSSSHPEGAVPLILRCTFGIGNPVIRVRPESKPPALAGHTREDFVQKQNGTPIEMNLFQQKDYAGISSIIYSAQNVLNHPAQIGDDMIIVHNPLARNPLHENTFNFLNGYKYDEQEDAVVFVPPAL